MADVAEPKIVQDIAEEVVDDTEVEEGDGDVADEVKGAETNESEPVVEEPAVIPAPTTAAAVVLEPAPPLPPDHTPSSVTPERKQELLLAARQDRLQWLQQVPYPYRVSSPAARRWPSSLRLLHALGVSEQEEPLDVIEDDPLTKEYRTYLEYLAAQSPLVQRIRNLCRTLEDRHSLDEFRGRIQAFLATAATGDSTPVLLESVLYGHVYDHFQTLLPNDSPNWEQHLQSLQFVTPQQLEVPEGVDLSQACATLQTIDRYWAPSAKLQVVHRVYQQTTQALHEASNTTSADDLLPALIYVVLHAQALRLPWNLDCIVDAKGEAGYAWTTLCGAVHFWKELDAEAVQMSPEDFAAAVQKCRQNLVHEPVLKPPPTVVESVDPVPQITVDRVREARLKGERLDLEWALQQPGEPTTDDATTTTDPPVPRSFLTKDPHDIALADLPQLLDEYQQLVKTNEQLLGEKATMALQSRKEALAKRQQELWARAMEVDPSLLPSGGS